MLANNRVVLYQIYMLLWCMHEFSLLGTTVTFSLNLLISAISLRTAEQFAVSVYLIKTLVIIHKGELKDLSDWSKLMDSLEVDAVLRSLVFGFSTFKI